MRLTEQYICNFPHKWYCMLVNLGSIAVNFMRIIATYLIQIKQKKEYN